LPRETSPPSDEEVERRRARRERDISPSPLMTT
jgi:hypothetical protein